MREKIENDSFPSQTSKKNEMEAMKQKSNEHTLQAQATGFI